MREGMEMGKISIQLLGQFKVTDGDGRTLIIKGRKQQALLTYLALNIDRPPSRDKIATVFWGERFDDQARQSLRQAISRLRGVLINGETPVLLAEGDRLGLNAEAVFVDAREFERLADDGSPEALVKAASLYKDMLVDGLYVNEAAFDDWIGFERARFQETACAVLSRLAVHQMDTNETQSAIETGRRLIGFDPLNEGGHRHLMRAYAANGQRAHAQKQYKACTALLLGEFGTQPEVETQRLFEEISVNAIAPAAAQQVVTGKAPTKTDKPLVAVLPFDNMSNNEDQDYFASGMTEDIITSLTKYRWLSVTARNVTAVYKGQSPDVREVAEELGADYVVEGSVRKIGDRLRVTAQLIDAGTGTHIWAERYDRNLEDIFELQDEIADIIVARVEPELGLAERNRVEHKPRTNLQAWDCFHLGMSHFYKFTLEDNLEAQRLLRESSELDPGFGEAHAWWAYAVVLAMVYWDQEPDDSLLDEAMIAADRALSIDDRNAEFYVVKARVALARREYSIALINGQAAIRLNPTFAVVYCAIGDSLAYEGDYDKAMLQFEKAISLSPNDPQLWGFYTYGALALIFKEDYEKALEWSEYASIIPNHQYWTIAHKVVALSYLDRIDEAQKTVTRLLAKKPNFSCDFAKRKLFYIKRQDQLERYLDGLRQAGVPEKSARAT